MNSVELLVSLVGRPDPAAAPAAPVEPGPAGGTAAKPTAVQGGTSYNDAPTVGAGSWTDTLRTSETLYYKVPVGWGQALRVTAAFTSQTADQGIAGTQLAVMEIHDALRADPLNRKLVQPGADTRTISITTPAVTAPVSPEDAVAPFKIAGGEYIVLNASPGLGETKVASSRVRLDVQVVGQQVEGPRLALLAQVSTPSPSPTASTPAAAGAPSPVAAPRDSTGTSDGPGLLPWILGALAVVLVGAAVAVLSRRRAGRQGG